MPGAGTSVRMAVANSSARKIAVAPQAWRTRVIGLKSPSRHLSL